MNVIERAKAVRDMALNDGKGCRCEARGRDECGCDAAWVSPRAAADSITDLLSIVEQMPKDAIDALPKDYCRGCLYSLLRWNRKDGIECADCYDADDERPQSLDDHDYDAIVAVLDWAFAAAEAAREGE